MPNFEAESDLFQEGHAFGMENLQRFVDRLKTLTATDDEGFSDFIYPALTVQVVGLVNLMRRSSDREQARAWLSGLLDSISECMSNNKMATRIKFTLIPLDEDRDASNAEDL